MRNLLVACFLTLGACANTPIANSQNRFPADEQKGTGTIGSSDSEPISTFSAYKLPITREQQQTKRLAFNFWSGEWPSPIIDVNAQATGGTTTVQGYKELRNPQDKVSCTIANGVYHPWSDNHRSLEDFWSLSEVTDYTIIQDIVLTHDKKNPVFEEMKIPRGKKVVIHKGSKIVNVYYESEGYCGATLQSKSAKRELSFFCGNLESDTKSFKRIQVPGAAMSPDTEHQFREQWLSLLCQGAGQPKRVFVKDEDILSQSGIKYGKMCGYGHASYEEDSKCGDDDN